MKKTFLKVPRKSVTMLVELLLAELVVDLDEGGVLNPTIRKVGKDIHIYSPCGNLVFRAQDLWEGDAWKVEMDDSVCDTLLRCLLYSTTFSLE